MRNLPCFIHLSIYVYPLSFLTSSFHPVSFILFPSILLFSSFARCVHPNKHNWFTDYSNFWWLSVQLLPVSLTHSLMYFSFLLFYCIIPSFLLFLCCTMCQLPVPSAIIFLRPPLFHSLPSTQHYRNQHSVTHYSNPQTY
jgi:hypothetical protein